MTSKIENPMKKTTALILSTALFLSLGACARVPHVSQAQACSSGLNQAFTELDAAKAKGFSGTVSWIKAASLLSAAKIQQQFGKYPNCLDKVHRAREYIRLAERGI